LLALCLAWAGDGLIRLFPRQRRVQHAPLFAAMIYVVATMPALQRLISVPLQPLRSVLASIDSMIKGSPEAMTATYGRAAFDAEKYDGLVIVVDLPQKLNALIDTAHERGVPLFVYHTVADGASPEWRTLTRQLETGGQFRLIREFPALDPGNNYRLYQYEPREQIIRLKVKPEEK
jgi:hypothetical protein